MLVVTVVIHGADDTHAIYFKAPDRVIHWNNFSDRIFGKIFNVLLELSSVYFMLSFPHVAHLVCPEMPLPVFWSPAENIKAYYINCAIPNCCDQNILILAPDSLLKSSEATP